MIWYIKVEENKRITDITSIETENYLMVDKDLKRFKYPIMSGIYMYNNETFEINEEFELEYLNFLEQERIKAEEELLNV